MRFKYLAVFILFYSASLVADDSINAACKTDKRVVNSCFKVHGRLSNWNGNPTQRIWIIGSNRILGVRGDTDLPKTLNDKLGDFDDIATADFEVCPLTPEKSGHIQIVCVASVSGIKMSKRKSR
jgi:hypothetical protein